MCLIPPHINSVSYPTIPPFKSPNQNREDHYSKVSIINRINWKIYQPENKNRFLLIKIISIIIHETRTDYKFLH